MGGYSIAGHALYGSHMREFSSVLLSAVTCLRMLGGEFAYTEMYKVDPAVSALFFVSFMVLLTVALLNMFIAIVAAHYNEFIMIYQEDNQDSLSFL